MKTKRLVCFSGVNSRDVIMNLYREVSGIGISGAL